MQCPSCPVSLERLSIGALELDECPRCLGIWFDPGELQQLLSRTLDAKNLPQRFLPAGPGDAVVGKPPCPRCVLAPLEPHEEHGRMTAGCAMCGGLWMPAPALAGLLQQAGDPELAQALAAAASAAPVAAAAANTPPAPAPVSSSDAPVEVKNPPPPAPASSWDAPVEVKNAPAPVLDTLQDELGTPPAPKVVPPRGAPPPAGAVQGDCPACGGRWAETSAGNQRFHLCERCGAAFFPKGGLPHFLATAGKDFAHHPDGPEPEEPPCPGCGNRMDPIAWQGRPVRVWACQSCWSMLASAGGLRRLCKGSEEEKPLQGPGLLLWRVLDSITEWLVTPPRDPDNSVYGSRFTGGR